MADHISLEVRCLDSGKKVIPVSSVALVDGFGGRRTIGSAPFRFDIPAAFEGSLEIRKAGHHDWNFPVRVSDSKGELVFKFHENCHSIPAMASVTSVAAVAAAGKKKEYRNELNYMKTALGWNFSADWYLEYK